MPKKVTALTAKKVARKKNQQTVKHPAPSAAALSQNALADPADLTPEKILALQRMVGNQSLQRLLAQTPAAAPKPAHENPGDEMNAHGATFVQQWGPVKRHPRQNP